MTELADHLRDHRRAVAAPGGPHDRLIHRLTTLLPAGVGMLVAVMVITPLFPRGEVSFLLDRTKVAMTEERLRVGQATYRGLDDRSRPFALNAGQAVQHSARVPVVQLRDLKAQMQLDDGPADLRAAAADYDISREQLSVKDAVEIHSRDGYTMTTRNVVVDMQKRQATGSNGVSGQTPAGTFAAERISADLPERKVSLDGRAHLRMVPGQPLKVPSPALKAAGTSHQ